MSFLAWLLRRPSRLVVAFGVAVAGLRAAHRVETAYRHELEGRSGVYLYNVHPPGQCTGAACPIHRRTDHAMRSFPQHWRADLGMMERVCPHGVGHPDPDDPAAGEVAHGCDGCCGADLAHFDGGPTPEVAE